MRHLTNACIRQNRQADFTCRFHCFLRPPIVCEACVHSSNDSTCKITLSELIENVIQNNLGVQQSKMYKEKQTCQELI